MEILHIEDLNFKYPDNESFALKEISFTVNKGDFVLVCGRSGCGKTTLLQLLKPEIAPFGEMSGKILFKSKDLKEGSMLRSAGEIGFVMQSPEDQVVTDKVWHELAFGLENIGADAERIRLKIAEIAAFFGIDSWLTENTSQLSGGQKQILSLASVLAMDPELLILDEPTAQLDPIATENFISLLIKINRTLGKTIIIAEHSLEELFGASDKILLLNNGMITACGTAQEVSQSIVKTDFEFLLPASARIFSQTEGKGMIPISVKEGRKYLTDLNLKQINKPSNKDSDKAEPVIEMKNIMFRYGKDLNDVLRDLNLEIYKNEFFCLLGSNGTGKTTAVNVMAGTARPYSGTIKILNKPIKSYKGNSLYNGVLSVLPQDPAYCFVKTTLIDDYYCCCKVLGLNRHEAVKRIEMIMEKLKIKEFSTRNPLDLSGGERQKAALGKVLLSQPEILILDEPTKAIDSFAKYELGKFLSELVENGITIVAVTHDVEFAGEFASRCGLLSDGKIAGVGAPQEFFCSVDFYTTAARRISKGIIDGCVTCEQVVKACKGGEALEE